MRSGKHPYRLKVARSVDRKTIDKAESEDHAKFLEDGVSLSLP